MKLNPIYMQIWYALKATRRRMTGQELGRLIFPNLTASEATKKINKHGSDKAGGRTGKYTEQHKPLFDREQPEGWGTPWFYFLLPED